MELTRQNVHIVWIIYSAGFLYTALVLPGLFWTLLRRFVGRYRIFIVMTVTLVFWVALIVYRERTFILRVAWQDLHDPGNTNDGQAGDVLLFAMGWLPPVLSMMVTELFVGAWLRRRRRRELPAGPTISAPQ